MQRAQALADELVSKGIDPALHALIVKLAQECERRSGTFGTDCTSAQSGFSHSSVEGSKPHIRLGASGTAGSNLAWDFVHEFGHLLQVLDRCCLEVGKLEREEDAWHRGWTWSVSAFSWLAIG